MRQMVLIVVAFAVVAGIANAAVEVRPHRVFEQRNVQIVKEDGARYVDTLQIILTLSGTEVADATHYGDLKLEEAVDDTGTNLMPAQDVSKRAARFQEFSNVWFRKQDKEKDRPVAAPQIVINLATAKRAATRIARLRGTISLADQGTLKTVDLTGLKLGDKKKIELPENAGVAITADIPEGNEIKGFKLAVTGRDDAIDSIEVHDAQGNKVGSSVGTFAGRDAVGRVVSLQKPLDDSMKLVVKVRVDRKITEVPFDIKDVELP